MKRTMTPGEWIENYVDIKQLAEDIRDRMEDALLFGQPIDGDYIFMVESLADSALEQYQIYHALEQFEFDLEGADNHPGDNVEEALEELIIFGNDVTEILNEQLKNELSDDFDVFVYFDFYDDWNDFGLIANVDEKQAKAWYQRKVVSH